MTLLPLGATVLPASHPYSFLFLKLFYLFTFDCAGSLLLCRLLSNCGKQGLLSSGVQASHCSGFSYREALALGCVGFRSCSVWAQSLWLCSGAQAH